MNLLRGVHMNPSVWVHNGGPREPRRGFILGGALLGQPWRPSPLHRGGGRAQILSTWS